jgi:short-subunit dehydrogenase
MLKKIAVFGAGPGIGRSVALRFGREGFDVALVGRTQAKLDALAGELAGAGITAETFTADVTDGEQVAEAVRRIGTIDVAEYSPGGVGNGVAPAGPLDFGVESLAAMFRLQVYGPLGMIRVVMPQMVKRGDGAVLITMGTAGKIPDVTLANVGIGAAGMRNYVHTLHAELAPRGVYAGALLVGALIEGSEAQRLVDSGEFSRRTGVQVDPAAFARVSADELAGIYWDMYTKRDRIEQVAPLAPLCTPVTRSRRSRRRRERG